MDVRIFWGLVLALSLAAGCDRQAKESQYSTAAAPVKGTEQPAAIVPAKPEPGKDHGNAEAQKGGSPNAGTGAPNARH